MMKSEGIKIIDHRKKDVTFFIYYRKCNVFFYCKIDKRIFQKYTNFSLANKIAIICFSYKSVLKISNFF